MIQPKHPIRSFFVQAFFAAIASLWLIFPCGRAQSGEGSTPPTRRVLLIFGEARELPGNELLEQSVKAAMRQNNNPIEFYTESLDASRFPAARHYQIFRDYIQNKYAGQKPDLVMVFMGRDFNVARDLVTASLTNIPAVFVVVNDLDLPELPAALPFTAVFQRFDVLGTLRFMFRLQPEIRRVVVVGGSSAADRALLGRIDQMARSVKSVTFDYWTNRPIAEIHEAAGQLPPDTVILLASVQRDSNGESTHTAQVARFLAPAADVPVYVLSDGLIGTGAVGGNVVDIEDLGYRAGHLATLALAGKPAGQMPIETLSNGVPMVDWRALQRWHINSSRLPAHCEVRFRPRSRWADHWRLILFVGLGFLVQAVTIAALLVQRRRQHQAEAEILRQRAELAHVSRISMMGQLASALTHELNQPLGAILRNAEAAEVYLQAEHPDLEELRAILTDIRRDDKRAGNVIDRMRSLFKRQQLTSGAIDLRDLAEDTVAMARPDAEARHVKLKLEIAPHLKPAQGDRVQVQQVLLNLVLNGMDAMNTTPKTLRSLAIRVQETTNGNLQVSVSDRGSGIGPDNAMHVFEPFFTTKSNGMGMGLAISKTIMEAHGGEIWMTSCGMAGTTFNFLLPPAGFDRIKPGDLPADA